MGSIYKIKNKERWRVQFRRLNKKTISACFDSYEEALTYRDEVDKAIKERRLKDKVKESLSIVKEDSRT